MSKYNPAQVAPRGNVNKMIRLKPSPQLQIEPGPDGTTELHMEIPGIDPSHVFQEAILRSKDPIIQASITQFANVMEDRAMMDLLNDHAV